MKALKSRGSLPGVLACALLFVCASASAQASAEPAPIIDPADDEEARNLFQIGKDAFDEGRFERALKYFKEAYELSHRPVLLSNIGTALDRLRRDQEAIDAYREYLERMPEAPNRRLVEERIRIIEEALARAQAEASDPPPTASTNEPLVPTPQETARAAPSLTAAGDAQHLKDAGATPVTSRWWFWTGIGVVAVAAVAVAIAVSASGGEASPAQPTLLDPRTRVREL